MDADRAARIVERYTAACSDPELDYDDVRALIADHAAAVDADGRCPADEDWTPTYSVRGVWLAVAEGWALKAGRAADRFDFTTDGQNFRRSQLLDHCEAQSRRYRRKANHSAPIG